MLQITSFFFLVCLFWWWFFFWWCFVFRYFFVRLFLSHWICSVVVVFNLTEFVCMEFVSVFIWFWFSDTCCTTKFSKSNGKSYENKCTHTHISTGIHWIFRCHNFALHKYTKCWCIWFQTIQKNVWCAFLLNWISLSFLSLDWLFSISSVTKKTLLCVEFGVKLAWTWTKFEGEIFVTNFIFITLFS